MHPLYNTGLLIPFWPKEQHNFRHFIRFKLLLLLLLLIMCNCPNTCTNSHSPVATTTPLVPDERSVALETTCNKSWNALVCSSSSLRIPMFSCTSLICDENSVSPCRFKLSTTSFFSNSIGDTTTFSSPIRRVTKTDSSSGPSQIRLRFIDSVSNRCTES